jgi:hypothetical protein
MPTRKENMDINISSRASSIALSSAGKKSAFFSTTNEHPDSLTASGFLPLATAVIAKIKISKKIK